MGDMAGRSVVDININNIINEPVPAKKELIGIYFEPEIARVLHKLKEQGKRGDQSKVVNKAMRLLLEQQGMLKGGANN